MTLSNILRSSSKAPAPQEEHCIPLSDFYDWPHGEVHVGRDHIHGADRERYEKQKQAAQQAEIEAKEAEFQADKIRQIAQLYNLMKNQLYDDLKG